MDGDNETMTTHKELHDEMMAKIKEVKDKQDIMEADIKDIKTEVNK